MSRGRAQRGLDACGGSASCCACCAQRCAGNTAANMPCAAAFRLQPPHFQPPNQSFNTRTYAFVPYNCSLILMRACAATAQGALHARERGPQAAATLLAARGGRLPAATRRAAVRQRMRHQACGCDDAQPATGAGVHRHQRGIVGGPTCAATLLKAADAAAAGAPTAAIAS